MTTCSEEGSWKEHWGSANNPFYTLGHTEVKADSWCEAYRRLSQNTDEWLAARDEFQLTSSRVGAIMGLDASCSAAKALATCRGQLFFDSGWSKEAKEWGQVHEPVAVRDLEEVTDTRWEKTGLHPRKAFSKELAGSPDRLAVGWDAVLEVKCPFSLKIPGEPKSKDLAQLFANLACTGRKEGMLLYWTPMAMQYWMIDWDQSCWDNVVYPQIQQFCRIIDDGTLPNKLRISAATKSANYKAMLKLVRWK